jgi:hypothetical protein
MLMGTRLRRLTSLAALSAAGAIVLLLGGATAADAYSGPPPADSSSGAAVSTNASDVIVTVSSTTYRGGSSGSGPSTTGAWTVNVSPPCWLWQELTGKDYYDYYTFGGEAQANHGAVVPRAGYLAHKDDVKGHWYSPGCDSGDYASVMQYYATHPVVYVEAGDTPATPPVPPEVLRETAVKNLHLPPPVLDWNPKRLGNHGTLVNVQTWFWLGQEPPTMLKVTAATLTSEAAVTVTFDGMDITAPGEPPVFCAGVGTPYTAGAPDSTCKLAFSRASSALGSAATPVTVKTRWSGTWTANGGVEQPLLSPLVAPTPTVPVVVDEVQTLVTGAR